VVWGRQEQPFARADDEAVRDHAYPLYDQMYIYINRQPAEPLNPKVKEFMRYILSREGQLEIARDTTMLPLTAAEIRVQLPKLD
jgi:phosphate transport system substrate-binding protein